MSVIEERIVASGHGSLSSSYFVVHSTANPGATADNHASLWSRQPDYAVHLVSDWTKCLHTVPYDRLCWQVGNGNRYVEGIEICEATNLEDFEKGIKIAADAVRERLAAHGWGADRLMTHHQAALRWGGSDHTDPDPYFSKWGYTWDRFVDLVASGKSEAEEKEGQGNDEMNALICPDDQSIQLWVCGDQIHDLDCPDTAQAVIDMYTMTHGGAQIPCFVYGSAAAPWFARFVQACRNGIPNAAIMDNFPGRAENRAAGNKGEE